MIPFAIVLQDSLDDAGLSRRKLMLRTEIEAPALSKYLKGRLLPSPTALAKIMGCLPADQAAKVFAAYLKEIFPKETLDRLPGGNNPVSLQKAANALAKKGEHRDDPELDEALEMLAYLARRKPEVKALLSAILEALK